jgi:putative Mg2+ transporter-C (MgtC) family protein
MIDVPGEVELGFRILLAALLGGFIGLEREISDHPAGLRTHVSVALGAALFGIVSGYGFDEFDASRTDTNFQVDPTRVASNIVTGVGFLGGGAILKYGPTVRGLTTAASLWVTAAIGLGCALGSYLVTLATTFALLAALVGLRGPSRWISRRITSGRETVVVRMVSGADPSRVVAAINELDGVRISSLRIREHDGGCVVQADLSGPRGKTLDALVAPLADRDDVADLDIT